LDRQGIPDPAGRWGVVGILDFDAAVEMDRACAELVVAKRLHRQRQQGRPFLGEHGGHLALGRAVDAGISPALLPAIEIDLGRVRVLEAIDDPGMLKRLLAAKAAVLWLFVAPFCSLLAIAEGISHHDLLTLVTSVVAICVIPVGCLPVAALIGIRWPYHALQIRYRWEHRQPIGRMIVRWAVLTLVPYVVVPALAILMAIPALVVLVRAHEGNSHVVNFINAFGKDVGLHVTVGSRPMSTSMFILCVAITCGVAVLTWRLGRMANLRLIRRRREVLTEWLTDPTMG
jgi:hypothetical protein